MGVVKYMVVIRITGSRRKIHGVTLGLGLGPKGPALMVVVN